MKNKLEQFKEYHSNNDWKALKVLLSAIDAVEIYSLMEELSLEDALIVFRLLDKEKSKEVFHLLSHDMREHVVRALAKNIVRLSELLNDIEPDDRTAFFEELPGKVTQRLLQYLSPKERAVSLELLGYPQDSIGRLMTPEYVAVKVNATVEQAFEHIRSYGREAETLYDIFIIDEEWKLVDDLGIKDLLLAKPEQKIEELIDGRFVSLDAMEDQELAIKIFRDHDRVALPVTNDEGVLLGIVTIDDIMDVVEEETTEDFQKFGSFQNSISDPLQASIGSLFKNRIGWLFALVFMNVFSGAAIASFEGLIQNLVSLVFFLPLLIDSGGNAGSQSATLMIRSLAIGDVKLSDWYKLIGKELVVSFLLGTTMALGIAAVASFRAPEIIAVVSLTMVLIVMTGSLIGMLLPFLLTRFKLDPATASAPLITSISDICGVLIYFSIANHFFAL